MRMTKVTSSTPAGLSLRLSAAIASAASSLAGALGGLARERANAPLTQPAPVDPRANAVFVEYLSNPSNLESDWLWLANGVVREWERRYCYEQALRINPNSAEARRGLARLDRR